MASVYMNATVYPLLSVLLRTVIRGVQMGASCLTLFLQTGLTDDKQLPVILYFNDINLLLVFVD